MPQTPQDSTELNEQRPPAPESGSEISDMVSSHELGIEVESQSHEKIKIHQFLQNPPSPQKPNFKSYEKEKTVEPCAPTGDSGQDDIILSGEVEIISKEQFVSNIAQKSPRLEKTQKFSKIPDYVCVEVGESLPEGSQVVIGVPGEGLEKRPNVNAIKKNNKRHCTFEASKDSWDQGDDIINVEVDHNDNKHPHTETPPVLNETIYDETPPPLPKIFKHFKKGRKLKMIQWVKKILLL
ncbi:hypothetical protein O181_096019 [Austropuccinia psidii MF-1]|uniref:Uncharacterized protein n=1 Tax=Austropuccinia psidii MF-1 TaxID=1389203 RepID=A0A9Q3J690_9BASI|nr:hypothetical protein [Austropuccinia psidii MF-1]